MNIKKGGDPKMAYDKFLAFPRFNLPSIWDDEDFWPVATQAQNNLSISEDDQKIYIEAAMPGIDPKNVDITFEKGYLWMKGEVKEEEKDQKRKYYRKATRSFSYRVAVPGDVDANAEPAASCKNGVLTVTFQKAAKAQPKKIQIKAA
jgi:HSP20 family protein